MGCIPSNQKKKGDGTSREKVKKLEDIKVDPGLFVTPNERSFQEVYIIGKIMTTGHYGEIRRVVHRNTKEERAVKVFRKDLTTLQANEKLKKEIEILKQVNHPNIIRIYEFFEEEKRLFVVLEKCQGGELFEEILKRKYFTEVQAANLIKQVLSAVSYLHEQNIIHRDLKPENILLENKGDLMSIKIIDFANAIYLEKNSLIKGKLGTAYYVAPEVLTGEYNEKCDMWTIGVIIFILLSGYPPFDGKTETDIIEKVKTGQFNFEDSQWEKVSELAKDLIKKLLCPAENRLSAIEALSHEWIDINTSSTGPNDQTIKDSLERLRNFHSTNKLRDAVHTFIAAQCLTASDTKELREVFKAIDINGDGKISKEELLIHYERFVGSDKAQEEVDKIMGEVDADKNGFIDYAEFLKANVSHKYFLSSENLRRAFDLFDKDGSGSISASELKGVLGKRVKADDAIWEQIIRSVDQNYDREIDLREFEEVILSSI